MPIPHTPLRNNPDHALDLGAGAAGPLQRYTAAEDIGAVILSHAHSDHWSDVTQLSYYRSKAIREGSDCGPLRIYGPSDMNDADGPMRGHLTAGDAGRLAAKSGAKLLILTHLRSWQDHLRLLDEASQLAGCPVILANPGLRVAL